MPHHARSQFDSAVKYLAGLAMRQMHDREYSLDDLFGAMDAARTIGDYMGRRDIRNADRKYMFLDWGLAEIIAWVLAEAAPVYAIPERIGLLQRIRLWFQFSLKIRTSRYPHG